MTPNGSARGDERVVNILRACALTQWTFHGFMVTVDSSDSTSQNIRNWKHDKSGASQQSLNVESCVECVERSHHGARLHGLVKRTSQDSTGAQVQAQARTVSHIKLGNTDSQLLSYYTFASCTSSALSRAPSPRPRSTVR